MSRGGGGQPCDPGDALTLLQGCPWPSVHLDNLALKLKLHLYMFRTVQSGSLKVSGGLAGGGAVHPQQRAWPRAPHPGRRCRAHQSRASLGRGGAAGDAGQKLALGAGRGGVWWELC